ncbi:MAG: glycosyltransferase [Firmicutes bacterium]|nr:glycosyltransferase [Bacillota bacterium]
MMNENGYAKKVSVIVPIYNGEKILEKSLFILSEQTLDDIEFICVNDASTDGSLNMLMAFKAVFGDKFVIIDSPKNGGPGGARNLGLKYARGEYIGFMDQDDYVHKDMFRDMYNEAKNGDYDIVKCSWYDKKRNRAAKLNSFVGELDDYRKMIFYATDSYFIWNKIYKSELISDMSMKFRENTYNDDIDFFIEAILRAKRASTVNKAYYYWNFEGESLSRGIKDFDLTKVIKTNADMLDILRKRVSLSPNREIGKYFYEEEAVFSIRRIYYNMFFKEELQLSEYEGFKIFALKYVGDYSELKNEGNRGFKELQLSELIFKTIDEEPVNMLKNVLRLKMDFIDGKFGEEYKEIFCNNQFGSNIVGGFDCIEK